MNALREYSEFQELITQLAKEFINIPLPQVDCKIQQALERVGEFTQMDRVYIFTYHFEENFCRNTYEWCAPGISSEINNLQHVNLEYFSDWVGSHKRGEHCYVPSVQNLPKDSHLYLVLAPQGIRSTISIPMKSESGECIGFIGFDAVQQEYTWGKRDVSLLLILAEIITNVETRIKYEKELVASDKAIRELNASLEERVALRTFQLESLNEELKAFSYSVSHDLRTPLRNINNYVQLLHNQLHNVLSEDTDRLMITISERLHEMDTLVLSLLEFSRISQHELVREQVDTEAMVDDVMLTFKETIELGKIQIERLPLQSVKADKVVLKQVWYNLLDNALKFTRSSPNPSIILGSYRRIREVVFYIVDNGVGFDERYGDRLFSVFQRLHPKVDFEGTGIGLANVRRIVNKHGGQVWANGKIGKGATFFFSIPD